MTTDIYEKHKAAFKNISGYVVTDATGNRLATIAFKYGNAVTCYLHIIGLEMTCGIAKGGGYDRKSAAICNAAIKTGFYNHSNDHQGDPFVKSLHDLRDQFKTILSKAERGGSSWDNALRDAGFNVYSAI